jgi:DNA-binding transcriptional LysR family regulator
MNLVSLYYFLKLAEVKQYTKASEQLHITQPSLSSSIQRLENELGVPLFERSGREVHLSRYGTEFYGYAKRSLDTLEDGVSAIRQLISQRSGSIDIGIIGSLESAYLAKLAQEYQLASPNSPTVNITQGLPSTLLEGLLSDRYDLVFCTETANNPTLQFEPVLHHRLSVLVHREHQFAKKRRLLLPDLKGQRIITYKADTSLGTKIKQAMDEEGLRPSAQVEDAASLASMVDLDSYAVGLTLDSFDTKPFDDLVLLPLSGIPNDFFPIYLVFKKSAPLSPTIKRFINLVKAL